MLKLRLLALSSLLITALGSVALVVAPVYAGPAPAAHVSVIAATTPIAPVSPAERAKAGVEALAAPAASQAVTLSASSPLTISALITPATSVTGTVTAGARSALTATNPITPEQSVTSPTNSPAITGLAPVTEALGTLEGTVIANLSTAPAKFFVAGALYSLPPRLSAGLDLPRPAEMLMLYTCSAESPDQPDICFWDAYLLQQGVLYEVRPAEADDANSTLLLAAAEPPDDSQVWVQNRTGRAESIVYRDQVFELSPAGVQDFPVSPDAPAVLYVRSCVNIDEEAVCEWSPKSLDAGSFYAMQATSTAGAEPGSTVTTINLLPILADAEAAQDSDDVVTCTLQVPAVNIRSGPGLQYEIVGKVRSTAQAPATLVATGQSVDQLWFTVATDVSPGGWVTSSTNFIACTGDVAGLPEVDYTGPAVAATTSPTPTPVAAPAGAPEASAGTEEEPEPEAVSESAAITEEAPITTTEDAAPPAIPPGQALLVVNNGFMHEVRFTIDQLYRPQEGPSEFDLQPGGSVAVVVYPGQVAFTASSPWNSLSGNAELYVEPDQAVPLWLRFEEDPADPGDWTLAWQ